MNREDVQQRFEAFLVLLGRENELKEELLALRMGGRRATADEAEDRLRAHQELIDAIERIRHQEMLPLLDELMAFVARARAGRVA